MTKPAHRVRFVPVSQGDPAAEPLLAELALEYAGRYGSTIDDVARWLHAHPAHEFEPPGGGLYLGLLGDRAVTGGAFQQLDADTAELKRIWTDSAHRQRGYATALLATLEAEIAERGYRRIYLTTGNRQPEAEALYLSAGYSRLAEPPPPEGTVCQIAFEKVLREPA